MARRRKELKGQTVISPGGVKGTIINYTEDSVTVRMANGSMVKYAYTTKPKISPSAKT